jgi:peptidoglycan/xylan/chitin deacetylase (PgdA/CDA1 family)
MGALILCYHHIKNGERIDPEMLESHLKILKKQGFCPVKLKDIYDFIIGKKSLPKKSVHLTFDDGYVDNFTYAYPLLKQYGFFGTIFVITSRLNEENLRRPLSSEIREMELSMKEVNTFIKNNEFMSWREAEEMQKSGLIEIESHSHYHRACFSSAKIVKFNNGKVGEWFYEIAKDRRLGIPVYTKRWRLSADCLEDDKGLRDYLAEFVSKNEGMLFFKRSSAFRILRKKAKEYKKKFRCNFVKTDVDRFSLCLGELKLSKDMIEERLNKRCEFLAYPWGDYDDLAIRALKQLNFLGGLTLNVGLNTPKTDPFLIRRVEARGKNWLKKRLNIYKSGLLSEIYSKVHHKI